jgi:antitoxin HicB
MKRPVFDDYTVSVRPLSQAEGGGYMASIVEIAGCVSDGETHEEAIANLRHAFDDVVQALAAWGTKAPAGKAKAPTSFVFRPSQSLYSRLKTAAASEGVSVNALLNEAVALRLGAALGRTYLAPAAKKKLRARAAP